ncbi:hypothetical protein F4811DRAFT_547601 [Daldinia bambusicola]|nr:hypothetical protein F4811DRAFT_547601 [Daldinia bambusicola]
MMGNGLLLCIFAFYATLLACGTGGYSYFATFVHNELYPYFTEYSMETHQTEARIVFAFLVTSAVLTWCFFLGTVLALFIDIRKYQYGRPGPMKLFISCLCMMVVAVLGLLILQLAWGWRGYFESVKMDWFASHCHGLQGMIIAILVIITVSFVAGIILRLCFLST